MIARSLIVLAVACTLPLVAATHLEPCIPTSADPYSYTMLGALGRTFYLHENNVPWSTPVAIPFSGLILADGTNLYEESNGLVGLQRQGCEMGGLGLGDARVDFCVVDWFPPGCDQNPDWTPTDGTIPCLMINEDPVNDETCHHGPDTIVA